MLLVIYRDKNCFGRYRAVQERFYKKSYRIKNGEVQVKHSGKWVNTEEKDPDHADRMLSMYKEMFDQPECWNIDPVLTKA